MIGILPCAGEASRIHGLPKYLLPVPGGYLLDWHVKGMLAAGCGNVYVGARPGNVELLADYTRPAVQLYLAHNHATMTQTVQSMPIIPRIEDTVFGMPDTYWLAPNVYPMLVELLNNGADVAVAAFWLRDGQYKRMGCVRLEENKVVEVVDKPNIWPQRYGWGALAWTPKFWDFMQPDDPHVGYALPRAIEAGLDVRAVRFLGGLYYDCGTEQEYFELCSLFAKDTENAR